MSKKKKFPLIPLFIVLLVAVVLVGFLVKEFLGRRAEKLADNSRTITTKGEVIKNNRDCFSESECTLSVRVENMIYEVSYLPAEGDCVNKVAPGMAWELNEGDIVEVFGKFNGDRKISICESADFYVKKLK